MRRVAKIYAISGSLRYGSSNFELLKALKAVSSPEHDAKICEVIGEIPLFSPELDPDDYLSVRAFRDEIQDADLVVISSPEYAHGVPGALKNALDWVVGTGEFVGKPVAFLYTTARGTYVQAQLLETLTVMDSKPDDPPISVVQLASNRMSSNDILNDSALRAELETFMNRVSRWIPTYRADTFE